MLVPVVLKSGNEELVSKDELQFLMFNKQIMFFKRSDGWAVVGRDKMRNQRALYDGKERRQHEVFSLDC
jgi:hypothetical protein